jgi:hypothetical protein
MRYFTRQQHDAVNVPDQHAAIAALDEAKRSSELYRRQLEGLKTRLSEGSWDFFDSVSLHDGTLLAMRVGDDIDKLFPTYKSILVNRRHLSVELEVLSRDETQIYTLRYDRLRRVLFDFPSSHPWYFRYSDVGSNPIDDWMADELISVDEQVLRHEVLFSSGATLLVDFEKISVRAAAVEGRQGLPYVEPSALDEEDPSTEL